MRDLYKILGVSPSATPTQIKTAYRALARKHHPDTAPPAEREEASRRFQEVHTAYVILSVPWRRRLYDLLGLVPGGNPVHQVLDHLDGQLDEGLELLYNVGQLGLQAKKVISTVRRWWG